MAIPSLSLASATALLADHLVAAANIILGLALGRYPVLSYRVLCFNSATSLIVSFLLVLGSLSAPITRLGATLCGLAKL